MRKFNRPESGINVAKQSLGRYLITTHEGWELPGNEGWAQLTAAQARALGHMLLGQVEAEEMVVATPVRICKQNYREMLALDENAEPPEWVAYKERKP